MKKLKFLSIIVSAVSAAAILAFNVCAYDFGNKNLGKNWSLRAEVPASEFAELTVDSYITVTFEADQAEEEYWCIKPLDSTWAFTDPNGEGGAELTEAGDAYLLHKEDTSITFQIPADFIESVKSGGMIFIGHSITLKTLTISDKAPVTDPTEPDNGTDGEPGNTDDTDESTPPNTGVEGAAVIAGIAAVAAAAIAISKKR